MKGNYFLSFVNAGKLNSSSLFTALTKDLEHDAKVAACLLSTAMSATFQGLSTWGYMV